MPAVLGLPAFLSFLSVSSVIVIIVIVIYLKLSELIQDFNVVIIELCFVDHLKLQIITLE